MKDRDYICPCARHEHDIAETGHCLCSLFVSDDYVPDPEDAAELAPASVPAGHWPRIVVNGASWCRDTRRTRRQLHRHNVPYAYVDVDGDPAAAQRVMRLNGGYLSTPTLEIDGRIVTEPTDEELAEMLGLEE